MKNTKGILFLTALSIFCCLSIKNAKSEVLPFNKNWKFTLSDSASYAFENYSINNWRTLNLPHDWSVEFPFDEKNGAGCTGYLPGGIGWYSKEFKTTTDHNQKCFLLFDGVYNNSDFWINGRMLGTHYSGYSPVYYDVSKYLNPKGETNRISVRVDHSRFADSRWYTGSGIYRKVNMIICDKIYIPIWGIYVTTPLVSEEKAEIKIDVDVVNDYDKAKKGFVVTDIFDSTNKKVGSAKSILNIDPGKKETITQSTILVNPNLWSNDKPNMYHACTSIEIDGKVVSSTNSSFGVRSIKFDAAKGFFLNGENMKIKGVCIHHDAGIVGGAVPVDVWRRRFKLLKECGCNAIRTAHNPVSQEFLDLCDEMGFLVQEEFFDEWDNPKDKRYNMDERHIEYVTRGYAEHFQECAENDLKKVVKRDRNHPSIIQWSIGNEIEWTYDGCKQSTGFFGADAKGGYFWNQPPYSPKKIRSIWISQPAHTYDIGRTAEKLVKWTKELDTTRPTVANCILPSVSFENGYIDALDMAGFSYRQVMYDYAHKHYPNKPIMGTENFGQWNEWKAVIDRDFVAGMYIWAGFDFMGERDGNRKDWPHKQSVKGLLDLAAFPKGSFYMMKSLWTEESMIALYTQKESLSIYKDNGCGEAIEKKKDQWKRRTWMWQDVNEHWNYNEGEKIIVESYSNCPEAELFLNGKSLGKQFLQDQQDHIYKWVVPFHKGTLLVKGYNGKNKVQSLIKTSENPNSIVLTADRKSMKSNEEDVVHVFAQLFDKKGNPVRNADERISFSITGNCKLLGVDNGYSGNVNPFQTMSVHTHNGRCMLLLQSTKKKNKLLISAKGNLISSNKIEVIIN